MKVATEYRRFDRERDLEQVKRIWREVGWVEGRTDEAALELRFATGDALVATLNDEAEAVSLATPGEISHLGNPLPLCAVTGVTTSRVARKLGFARQLTARLLADYAVRGYAVAALGMFEQGFYNRLGFGSGPYEHLLTFDPSSLLVDQPFRPPVRLGLGDHEEMHRALLGRRKSHGAVNLLPPKTLKAELMRLHDGFGLGYRDAPGGGLSHFLYGNFKGENGPIRIYWLVWRKREQLLELLALLRSFGDQVDEVRVQEFADLQLQDLVRRPISDERNEHTSLAFWQLRMLDLLQCVKKTRLFGPDVEFNLALHDPIEDLLPKTHPWRGLAGEYHVHLGAQSFAGVGFKQGWSRLTASVNAFSRLWLGVSSAPMLAITDQLEANDSLLKQLELSLCLPTAHVGWEF